ncbi:heme-binding protein [Brevundimonas sp.]|uniref:heme-binding protein n=1 Tax=Brevundimonas sp. TaxID=1871086 RepID=UPI00272F3FD9|nr:heme-binding protein [Brevundimonas sp.]MDP1913305.1 heme-binding protein [Brevundimonas sp.]
MSARAKGLVLGAVAGLVLAGCGGGGSSSSSGGGGGGGGSGGALYAVPAAEALSVADVEGVLARAVAEAHARSRPAVIAVTDRVGNVLGVYSMTGAPATVTLRPGATANVDLQGVVAPAAAGAIAKALTGAYLSSGGNAFSSRTASMIVQQHFPPAPSTVGLESGPLFGVQFSQLPCSDISRRFVASGGPSALIGPKRSPLGLAADPGGFPLYKNGVLVGGVGVIAESDYGFDINVLDVDVDIEEHIAFAAGTGLAPAVDIVADRVAVDGTTLRYSDAAAATLMSAPASAPGFGTLPAGTGVFTAVPGYYAGSGILAGQAYGTEASGVRKATTGEFNNADAFILTDGSGGPRYPVQAGTDAGSVGASLTAAETRAILEEAFTIMSRARAQIRRPLDSRAQVSIAVVDTHGVTLGLVRSPDAPLFGIDVAVQKARTASFLSNAAAAADLSGDPSADVRAFVGQTRTFLSMPTALTGQTAFSVRGIGNLARPYFPDGEVGPTSGPLSRPIAMWSPFSTGLQTALILTNLGQHVGFVSGLGPDTVARCTALPDAAPGRNRLQNGLQIFPGGVPIYRGTQLIGAIGVSGDGIDQDDMISFLGLQNAAIRVGGIGQAPAAIRSDQIVVTHPGGSTRLRYVSCPFAPFLDSSQQNVCSAP